MLTIYIALDNHQRHEAAGGAHNILWRISKRITFISIQSSFTQWAVYLGRTESRLPVQASISRFPFTIYSGLHFLNQFLIFLSLAVFLPRSELISCRPFVPRSDLIFILPI